MARVTQEHVDARLEAIREAAMRMFVQKGVAGATVQEIATEAGLSAGAIYRYYPSKEHLLQAVWSHCTEEMEALFAQAQEWGESPLDRLIALGQNVFTEMKEEGALEQAILQTEATLAAARHPGELSALRRDMRNREFTMLARMVGAAQEAGQIDPALDTKALAIMLASCVDGLRTYRLELGDDIDTDSVYRIVVEVIQRLGKPQGDLAV